MILGRLRGAFKQFIDPDIITTTQSPFEARRAAAQDLQDISDAQVTPLERVAAEPQRIELRGREWPFPKKASLVSVVNPSDYLKFHFNPPEFSHTLETNWTEISAPGYDRPLLQWTSGGPHTISLRLFFLDFWRGLDRLDVEASLEWLIKKLYPPETGPEKKSPELLSFVWSGRPLAPRRSGQATDTFVLRDVAIDRTQFNIDLVTVRAAADITLSEYIESVI